MAKSAQIIRTTLPRYDKNKPAWRRAILKAVMEAGVTYKEKEHLEVTVMIYLHRGKGVDTRDVDNLAKHVLDSLQGRFGADRDENCLIPNDNQIRRLVVEKRNRPKNLSNVYGGKLLIRPYKRGRAHVRTSW